MTTPEASFAAYDDVRAVRDGVQALGRNFDGEVNAATQALYLDLQRSADRTGVRKVADIAYGPHDLQKLDLFAPAKAPDRSMPVVVYLHGGGFVRGDKIAANSDDLIYSNIPTFLARNGIVGINANYRLAPQARWPSGPEDVKAILMWIKSSIGEHGGDARYVVLMGNSAGSAHAAAYLFHEEAHFDDGPGVAGAVLSSGTFAAGESEAVYYGEDSRRRRAHAPLGLLETYRGAGVPIFLWSAELDPAFIEVAVARMYAKLCQKFGRCPRFTQFRGHNHVSHVMSINSADDAAASELLDFVRSIG